MNADTSTVDDSLHRCPECRYSLRELPVPHACPECGLPYDRNSRAWYPLSRSIAFGGLVGYASGSISMVVSMWMRTRHFGVLDWLLLVVWAAGGFVMVWWSVRCWRLRPYVSVGPDGVRIRVHGPSTRFVPWTELAGVVPQRYDRACRLIRRRGRDVHVAGVFRSAGEVMDFVDRAGRYLRPAEGWPAEP